METKELRMWDTLHEIKKGIVNTIVEELGDRTLDVSECNVEVFAIEHHCNAGLQGTLVSLSTSGFVMAWEGDTEEFYWYDMIVEDLAMVLDYLRTGSW